MTKPLKNYDHLSLLVITKSIISETYRETVIIKKASKTLIYNVIEAFSCCRGRDRTSKWQLAITQSSVVDPGRPDYSGRLYVTFIP